jgi:hypothetical protein
MWSIAKRAWQRENLNARLVQLDITLTARLVRRQTPKGRGEPIDRNTRLLYKRFRTGFWFVFVQRLLRFGPRQHGTFRFKLVIRALAERTNHQRTSRFNVVDSGARGARINNVKDERAALHGRIVRRAVSADTSAAGSIRILAGAPAAGRRVSGRARPQSRRYARRRPRRRSSAPRRSGWRSR